MDTIDSSWTTWASTGWRPLAVFSIAAVGVIGLLVHRAEPDEPETRRNRLTDEESGQLLDGVRSVLSAADSGVPHEEAEALYSRAGAIGDLVASYGPSWRADEARRLAATAHRSLWQATDGEVDMRGGSSDPLLGRELARARRRERR